MFNYRYLINEPDYCQKENGNDNVKLQASPVDILIFISSAVSHQEQREAIRGTWGSTDHLRKYKTKVLFLLGQGNDRQAEIIDESHLRRDIIQEDFHVSTSNR